MTPIAITGIGLVDSLGNDLDSNFRRICNYESTIRSITNYDTSAYSVIPVTHGHELSTDLDFRGLLSPHEVKHLDRFIVAGFYAAMKAIDSAEIKSANVGIIYSSLHAGSETIHDMHSRLNDNKRSPVRKMLSSSRDYLSNIISQKFEFKGVNLCITSACASGIVGLDYACKMLEAGVYDYMIVGGADLMVDPFSMYTFSSLGAMDTSNPPSTKPFDTHRNGFTMGEGACCMVLEKLSNACHKKIHGVIRGVGYANEAFHDTAMTENAEGAEKSIAMALNNSNLEYKDIDIINCHATGTPNGDIAEYGILSKYFAGKPVSAVKPNIGHTMGACSLLEIAYGLRSLETSILMPILNIKEPMGKDVYLPQETQTVGNMKYMLKNSFGFGGKCGSVVIEKV